MQEDKSGRNREEEEMGREALKDSKVQGRGGEKGAEKSLKGRKRGIEGWTGGSEVEKRSGAGKRGEGGGSAERVSESASRRHFIMSPFTETFSFTL